MRPIKITGIILLLIIAPFAAAQEEELTGAGVTPDSPLYAFDRVFEKISLLLTFNDAAKAEKHLQIASERFAESMALIGKGKTQYSVSLAEDYLDNINSAYELAASEKLTETERSNLFVRIKLKTKKHISIAEHLPKAVPGKAQETIMKAGEEPVKGFQKTKKNETTALAEVAEGYLKYTEEGLNKVRGKSDDVLESMSDRMAGKVKEEIGIENKTKK